jgi:1-deoxy-D-xylulose-5-phosphate reductoisomerase
VKRIALLGATGSIGASTLDLIARHPERLTLVAAAAQRNVDSLAAIAQRFPESELVLADRAAAAQLASRCGRVVASGPEAIVALATQDNVDVVVAGIVGIAGLASTLAALEAGKTVLIANKEPLVAAGALVLDAARRGGATLLPLDSEHNAVLQAWPGVLKPGHAHPDVARVTLTASGGPFLDRSRETLASIKAAEAVRHPRWSMGPKISVDSATLMNKGLELIEASVLFGLPSAQIDVLIHPQSTVHALVEMIDGSVLAQLGVADMRIPIAHALGLPDRIASGAARLDLTALGALEFRAPNLDQFPCLQLARAALEHGGSAPLILNAANEVAVEAFLDGRLQFLQIDAVVRDVLETLPAHPIASLDAVLALDHEARQCAVERCLKHL